MKVAIEASNIRAGGGITHLRNLLRYAEPARHGISRVVVWSGRSTLDQLPDAPWLEKRSHPWLDGNIVLRTLWKTMFQYVLSRREPADVLFVPGANVVTRAPYVSMSQNMLPFDAKERARFAFGWEYWRYHILRIFQAESFRHAQGVIFLSKAAARVVSSQVRMRGVRQTVIPHGISSEFLGVSVRSYQIVDRIRILYVSIVNHYKHQVELVQAVAHLRRRGYAVELTLVGPAFEPALAELERVIVAEDPAGEFVRYVGAVPHAKLPVYYGEADIFAFPSTCENMPNILIEAMAAALPIACSDKQPMPEVLGEAGLYFDAEDPYSIAEALARLADNEALRAELGQEAHDMALHYSWERCADETFGFLARVALACARR